MQSRVQWDSRERVPFRSRRPCFYRGRSYGYSERVADLIVFERVFEGDHAIGRAILNDGE
jgi:hypothetical protein